MLHLNINMSFKPSMDVESEFSKITIQPAPLVLYFMKLIDGAEYCTSNDFIDRFGYRREIEKLSTGCKAALLVSLKPDLVVDLGECGNNVRDAIIKKCREGNIMIYQMELSIQHNEAETACEVEINGHVFYDIRKLNHYLLNDWLLE